MGYSGSKKVFIRVIPNHTTFNGFEMEHDFANIGEKVLVLNARRVTQKVHRKQLILLAIEDITEHRQAQKMLLNANYGSETWRITHPL